MKFDNEKFCKQFIRRPTKVLAFLMSSFINHKYIQDLSGLKKNFYIIIQFPKIKKSIFNTSKNI